MSASTIPFVIVAVFALVFIYAAIHEYRRLRREGPLENPRDAFEFDEDAPSYEEPPDQPEPAEDGHDGEAPDDTAPDDAAPDDTTRAAQAPHPSPDAEDDRK